MYLATGVATSVNHRLKRLVANSFAGAAFR
jgi:hypothetical protein